MEDAQAVRPKAQHDPSAPPAVERSGPDAAEREAHAHGRAKAQGRRPRHLELVGRIVLAVAAAAGAYGVISREGHETALAKETDIAAVPVVGLVSPLHGTGPRSLVLPGDVQAYFDAPLYARVNGYVKAWYHDIGARVTKGEVLATIDTPELDEQLDQARGDLAMAQANLSLAQVTAKRWHALLATNSVSQQSADEKASNALAQEAVVAAQKAHVQRLLAMAAFKNIMAPFNGVVTARNTDVGALINQGSSNTPPLFKVADVHEMRVYVRVPHEGEADAAAVSRRHLPGHARHDLELGGGGEPDGAGRADGAESRRQALARHLRAGGLPARRRPGRAAGPDELAHLPRARGAGRRARPRRHGRDEGCPRGPQLRHADGDSLGP